MNTSVSVAQILQNNPNLQHVKGKADIGIKVRIFFAKELHHFLNLCRAGLSEACGQLTSVISKDPELRAYCICDIVTLWHCFPKWQVVKWKFNSPNYSWWQNNTNLNLMGGLRTNDHKIAAQYNFFGNILFNSSTCIILKGEGGAVFRVSRKNSSPLSWVKHAFSFLTFSSLGALFLVGLLSLILKSLIKSLMQKSDIGAYIRHFEMCLTSVGLFVQELWAF